MKVDASTLTRNLRPLTDAGLLVMEPGPDARSRFVRATDAGREKRLEAQRRWRVAQESMNQRLGPHRVVALHACSTNARTCWPTCPKERSMTETTTRRTRCGWCCWPAPALSH
jgi:hypothetical protein